ncbi:MAG TPA: ATP-binding protein [Anaerolineales bacterium]
MYTQSSRSWVFLEQALPWLVLAILAIFTYSKFFLVPYAGFEFSNREVSEVYLDTGEESGLRAGDRLIEVGPVKLEEFERDLRLEFFEGVAPGQEVRLSLERNDQNLSIAWVFPGPTRQQIIQRLNSQWWIVYVFWMAGTATLLFVRPREARWGLLIALNYVTAIWLAAGSGPSHWHVGESAIVLRAAVWLSLPVYLHFHWSFPRPLARIPALAWAVLYLAAGTLAVLEVFQALPPLAYFSGFVLGMAGSILLLIAHTIFQKTDRRQILALVLGIALVFVPPLGLSAAYLLGFQPSAFAQGGAMLALPALPGAYFFAVYLPQVGHSERQARRLVAFYLGAIVLGTLFILSFVFLENRIPYEGSTLRLGIASTILAGIIAAISFFPFLALPALSEPVQVGRRGLFPLELRANRLVSIYLFIILTGAALTLLILVANNFFDFPGSSALIAGLGVVIAVILALAGFAPFQRAVEQRLLAMPLPPTHLTDTYSERITTALEPGGLIRLLKDEIIPTLLVRQSALMYLEADNLRTLFSAGLEEAQLPAIKDLPGLLERAGIFRSPTSSDQDSDPYLWIRLVFPLAVNQQLVGIWLLGRRDPDNVYTLEEISVLQSIAHQTAIALANIAQAERLHALYRANIERQEQERTRLALSIHDEILSQMALLTMSMDEAQPAQRFDESYQKIVTRLREMVHDLRPAMLSYGLRPAFEELVDELSDRTENAVTVQLDMPQAGTRYDSAVEQHLFRIVQQACENAVRHAQAKTIRIQGDLDSGQISISVIDDGIGFTGDSLTLDQLLVQRHYGLVGIHERAALIGAELKIDSAPGIGTQVTVNWKADSN